MIVIQIFQSFQIPFWSRVPPLVQLFFLNLASYQVLPVLPSYSVLIHQPPAQPPLSAPLSCLTLLTWLTELPMSSRPLPPAWLLFMTLQLGVSKPAFPIPAGFPSPNCMSRSHTREGSHRPQKGYLLPACMGSAAGTEDPADYSAVDWLLPRMMWRSWVGKSQRLWVCWSSRYLLGTSSATAHEVSTFQIMKIQNFHHPNNMFCSLADYQTSLWGSKWLILSSHMSVISWHLFFFHSYLWWDAFLSHERSEFRFVF